MQRTRKRRCNNTVLTTVSPHDYTLTQEYPLIKVTDTQHILFVQLVDSFEVQLKIAHVQQTVVSVLGTAEYLQIFRINIDFY